MPLDERGEHQYGVTGEQLFMITLRFWRSIHQGFEVLIRLYSMPAFHREYTLGMSDK